MYRIYLIKCRGFYYLFSFYSAALIPGRRLFQNGVISSITDNNYDKSFVNMLNRKMFHARVEVSHFFFKIES